MAQMQADRPAAGAERANFLARLTYVVGSVVSVGLVIGMGVWGYKLLVRDVSGVPVIRAAEGPMRVQPEDPGGDQASHQGLAVNAVAAAGSAEPAADRLILAPAPLDLQAEDVPVAADPPDRQDVPADRAAQTGDAAPAPDTDPGTPPGTTPDTAPEMDDATVLALAEALAEGTDPLDAGDLPAGEDAAPEDDEDVTGAGAAGVASSDIAGGLARSLRPRQRPATLSNVQPVSVAAPEAGAAGVAEVDPATIPAGTRLAQLGAYASEDIAVQEWTRLSGRFEDYLTDKSRVIQRAESGGRTFYRLRAMGFDDLADARRFCSALVAEQAECIPVVTR